MWTVHRPTSQHPGSHRSSRGRKALQQPEAPRSSPGDAEGRRGIRPSSPTQTLPKMLRRLSRVGRGTMGLSGNLDSGLRVFPSAVLGGDSVGPVTPLKGRGQIPGENGGAVPLCPRGQGRVGPRGQDSAQAPGPGGRRPAPCVHSLVESWIRGFWVHTLVPFPGPQHKSRGRRM